jgi:hypothetical protein
MRSILQMHPWYESLWREELGKLPQAERDETLFKLAARWADDIRRRDPAENHPLWHFLNWPFKPEGEPESVQTKPPAKVTDAAVIPTGYTAVARPIADRRMILAGYRLAELLKTVSQN